MILIIITFLLTCAATAACVLFFVHMINQKDSDSGTYGLLMLVVSAYLWWITFSIINYELQIEQLNNKPSIIEPDSTILYKI